MPEVTAWAWSLLGWRALIIIVNPWCCSQQDLQTIMDAVNGGKRASKRPDRYANGVSEMELQQQQQQQAAYAAAHMMQHGTLPIYGAAHGY
jgi:hypothetical protein